MEALIKNPSMRIPKQARKVPDQHEQSSSGAQRAATSASDRNAADDGAEDGTAAPRSNTIQHDDMPDIENYEPTDAELAEMLETARTNNEGADEELKTIDTDELGTNDASIAHGEYDSVASEDDIILDTTPKTRPFNHELLTHQYLGVAALGQPVEALVLKDPNRMKRTKKTLPVYEPEAADASVELKWSDYVEPAGEEKDPALEAWDNLDEMKPVDSKTISVHEYHKLVDSLVEGFTRGQLASYITMKHAQELEAEAGGPAKHGWVVKQTPWTPAHEIDLQDTKPKYLLSAAIIDKVWKLEVREQVASLGRTLLWVTPITFKLLTGMQVSPFPLLCFMLTFAPIGHGRHVLESIQRDMLNAENSERLAAKSEECRIGIYASKAAIPPIVERLHEAASAITSAQLSTEQLDKDLLEQSVLDSLAGVTSTIIEKDSSGRHLTVHWIADADRPKPTSTHGHESSRSLPEGPADIVWRLLMAAQTSRSVAGEIPPLIVPPPARGKKSPLYVDYHREGRSMSWRDKQQQWSRLVGPVAAPSGKKARRIDKTPESLELASHLKLPHLEPVSSEAGTASEVISATFGHILQAAAAKKTSTTRRILSPVIPHPAALTSLSANDEPVAQSTAIILNFSPDITRLSTLGSNDSSQQPLPDVRLTLPVDETTDLANFGFPPRSTLHAVAARRVQDVLLPSGPVDVRLTRQRLTSLDAEQHALQTFLAASEFDLLEGRLRTPSRISLTLPGETQGDVPYLFMGLEVHQAVETTLGGHAIRYESIEAGQHGGQRQELSLLRAVGSSGEDDGFLQLVEDVASGRVFSWNDGHELMQERSNEQFTMDLLEDAELAEEISAEEEAEPVGSDTDGAAAVEQLLQVEPEEAALERDIMSEDVTDLSENQAASQPQSEDVETTPSSEEKSAETEPATGEESAEASEAIEAAEEPEQTSPGTKL